MTDNINGESNMRMTADDIAPERSAWFIRVGGAVRYERFSVTIAHNSPLQEIEEGDGVLIAGGDPCIAVAFARLYRIRATINETTLYFDGVLPVHRGRTIDELGVSIPNSEAAILRLEWPVFEKALKTANSITFDVLPALTGVSADEQAYIRELLQYAVMDDLLGPANGPYEEIVGMGVRDRYLVGKLAPQDTRIEDEDEIPDAGVEDSEEGGREVDASTNQSLVPSSMGFTFCVDAGVENIHLRVSWGRYERRPDLDKYIEHIKNDKETGKPVIDKKTGKPEIKIERLRCWKRIHCGGTITLKLADPCIKPIVIDQQCQAVVVQGSVGSPLPNGDRLVTLFLVNDQPTPEQNQDQAWVFQPEMIVRDPEGRAIFRRRPVLDTDGSDDERISLEMIYRRRVEFAVGHGVSVHATTPSDNSDHAVEVRTCVLPQYEIPVTEIPGTDPEDRPAMRRMLEEGYLDMARLAEMSRDELLSVLTILTDDYDVWIGEQRQRIGNDVQGYDATANEALDRCQTISERLREGIAVLERDDKALDAFHFANRAMAAQRVHSIYALARRRGENPDIAKIDTPKNHTWRPFQLAFILLSIPALADPKHTDRTAPLQAYADLLWFPTAGGKTEAYLGVAAFTMAIRRRQGNLGGLDASRGLAVIMRYTLRLLTIQQFQRATTLICAMEILRRADPAMWGQEPFTIGLWVGQRVTPNTTEESHKAIESERDGKRSTGSTPAQLTTCPWCGSEIKPGRDIDVRPYKRDIGRTLIYCGDVRQQCEFSRAHSNNLGIPVLVVDDEIYRRPPSMLIATVDKFAMMAWRGQVRTLFGYVEQECPRHGLLWPDADCTGTHQRRGSLPATSVRQVARIRPPDLIIQDEFHLISGPLGTMVALYETAVDELSTWGVDGKAVRPKIIASTATVRKAEEQVNNVFLRQVAVFPPHGLDVEDNFFSVQRHVDEKPGRRYLGICSPGSSRPAVLIRVYVALLTAAQSLFERFGQVADPYMTLVGYFNSLRELGGMRRLAEDDVQTRAYRVQMSDVARPGLSQRSVRNVDELTSRVSSKEIPKKLDQLEVKYKMQWAKGEARSIDVVLATNMLSVGVDVNRLGLMVVNGQPKNTAEYIQATSRVGRSFPGLVCTVLTWSRPRDLSHYETFEHYHATFYKHVEAQSVTPFAPRALDRGLTGTMISLLRLEHDTMNPNVGAQSLDSPADPAAIEVKDEVSDRAWKITNKAAAKKSTDSMVADRIDRWVKEAIKPGRQLGYETERGQGNVAGLLKKPGAQAWDEFTVPLSMREVEPGVQLVMDVMKVSDLPPWRANVRDDDQDGGDA